MVIVHEQDLVKTTENSRYSLSPLIESTEANYNQRATIITICYVLIIHLDSIRHYKPTVGSEHRLLVVT